MNWLYIFLALGFLLSLYSFYVDRKVERSKKYKAVCDVTDHMSCSDAARSDYAAIGGIRNSLKGMVFYPLLGLFTYAGFFSFVFVLVAASLLMTVYLAYASYIKLHNYCVVCTSIYLVNIALFVLTYRNF